MNTAEKIEYAENQIAIALNAKFNAPSDEALIDAEINAEKSVSDAFSSAIADGDLKSAVWCSCLQFSSEDIRKLGVSISREIAPM